MFAEQNATVLLEKLSESRARAVRYVACLDRQISSVKETGRIEDPYWLKLRTPVDIVPLLMSEIGYRDQEHFVVILVNGQGWVLGIETVYKGSVHTCMIRTAELFRKALAVNAIAVVMAHNHPGGDPAPSADDVEITRRIVAVGDLLDIVVLDHIIVSGSAWVSMKALGLAFKGGENERG